ncbi:MAG: MFS transporter, partial [Spirochaetales bacterium]|nr:MFS transporter [Spirochaetales bacterium]
MPDTPVRKIKLRNYIAYGAGDLYGGGAFFIVTTFSMFYLVNVVGMNPILAGLIPALGKIWDAVSDPLMGYIADNTRDNRYGRRRVWFLISILPIALSFTLIWFPAGFHSQVGKFVFYLFAYIFFFTVATVSYVPYAALSAEMTYDRGERNTLNGVRILFSFIATLIAGVAVKPIIDGFGGTAKGYLIMGIVFGLIFALPWVTLYFGTWELPQPVREKEKVHFFRNFLSMFENKSCRIHVAMYVCSFGTMDVFMAWIMFYFIDYLKMSPFFVIAQGALLITMMLVLPLYVKIANTRGHGTSYMIGMAIFFIGMIAMGFLPPVPPP